MRRFPSSLLQFTPRDRVPSFFAIGMLIGAIWYFSLPFEPGERGLGAAVLFSGLFALWTRRAAYPGIVYAAAIFLCGANVGAMCGSAATARQTHATIEQKIGPVLVEGWIKRAEPARRGVRLVIAVHAIDGIPQDQTPNAVRVTHISALQTQPGRFVRCWAVLRPPPPPVIEGDYAFDRQAWYEGLGGVGYVQGRCRGGALGSPADTADGAALDIGRARRQLAQHVHQAAGARAGGFAAALTSGDRSYLSEADQNALRRAGLAHLLAISGLHVGIVGGLIYLIVWRGLALIEPIALRWSVKKPAALAALLACGAYLIISGASVSTQRAFIMALALFGAVLVDRTALTLRSLALAMIAVIALAPWTVLTPGFQMSFAATAVLVTIYGAWQKQRQSDQSVSRSKTWFWIKSLIVTSIATSLATAPFAFYHFERVPSFGVLANIAAMPIISLITAPFAALALILSPIGLDDWALRAFGLSLEWVLTIAYAVGDWSIGEPHRLPKMPPQSLALFAIALIIVCLFKGVTLRASMAASLCVLAFAAWHLSVRDRLHWAPSGDVFLEHASGEVERISAWAGEGLSPLRFSDLESSASCAIGTVCHLDFRGHAVTLINADQISDCTALVGSDIILTVSDLSACGFTQKQLVFSRTEMVLANGVTLEWRGGTPTARQKPACTSRPWRTCVRPAMP